MAKQIAKLLKASIQETSDLKEIAKMLAKKGRGGDTMLAHITPKEAAVLKESGGAGTVNPDTGLLEFYDGFDQWADFSSPNLATGGYGTRSDMTYSVPTGDVEPISPYSFAPNTPPINLTPPDTASYYSADTPQERLYPDVSFAPPVNIFEGRPTQFPISPEVAQVSPVAAPEMPTPPAPSALQRYIGDPLKQLKEATGMSGADLARVGLSGVGALAGAQQQQRAARQIQQAVAEQKALGVPYQQRGAELQRAAQAGELTPQSAQAYQALRAQLAQGAEARGGVGAAQAQAQLEAFRQNLLQNQYDFGLKVSQIGDQVALGAIRTGMQLDQQLGQASQQFYTQLAGIAAGGTYGYQPPTRTS